MDHQPENSAIRDAETGSLTVRIWIILAVLSAIALLLCLLDPIARRFENAGEIQEIGHSFSLMFDLDQEGSVPSWYSSSLWLFAAALAVLNGAQSRTMGRGNWHWWGLAGLFALLSMDESAALHENIGDLIYPHTQQLGGMFSWAWVFYGFALLAIATLLFGKFLLTLPRRIFVWLAIGAVLFVIGALGAEMYAAAIAEGEASFLPLLTWTRLVLVEEFLEMTGTIIAIGALLFLLRDGRHVDVAIR